MGPGHAALSAHPPNLTIRVLSPYGYTQPDDMGCQTQHIESALQRRERIAFLKRRECARRVAIWMHETGFVNSKTPPRRDPPLSWERPGHYDRENEPYVIYTSSPSSPSTRTPLSLLPTPRARPPPPIRVPPPRVSPTSTKHHRRAISLSSISELPEED